MFYILQAFNLPLIGNHAVLCFSLVTIVKNYKTNRSILQLNISICPQVFLYYLLIQNRNVKQKTKIYQNLSILTET